MLSRVAERMYWFGRLIERAENTIRLINVNANLILDLPRMRNQIWTSLIDITGSNTLFYKKLTRTDERNVIRFMLTDEDNPGSLISTVKLARENGRVTREILPSEAWERINEFYLYVRKNADKSLKRDGRFKFLNDVTRFCSQITGQLFDGMSHGHAYSFVRLGINVERADMGTRIVDVGCLNLLRKSETVPEVFNDLLWMNVLRSLSAYQTYRQHVKDRVNGEDVVDFLLRDRDFPRSINHCLYEINKCFTRLPENDIPLRGITQTQRLVHETDTSKLLDSGLHEYIDEIQIELGNLHTLIAQTWFGHEVAGTGVNTADNSG